MIIIPAIDIIDGKCVRLTRGDYTQKTIYNDDPLEIAKEFEQAGLHRLHLVDLDGAKTGKVTNWNVLEKIASHTGLKIDFSGGISDLDSVQTAFDSGASFVAVGSVAAKQAAVFSEWIKKFGPGKFIVGADVKNEMVLVRGWTEATSLAVYELIDMYYNKDIKQFFCTDIDKDGVLAGPAIELYKKIISRFPGIELIASGGVSNLNDLELLEEVGCYGAIVGKAIYENRVSLTELKKFS